MDHHTPEPNIPAQNNDNLDIRSNSKKETGKKITQYHTRGYKKLNSLNPLVSKTYESGIRRSRLRKDIIQNKRDTYKEEIPQIENVAEVDDYSESEEGESVLVSSNFRVQVSRNLGIVNLIFTEDETDP
ncbi:hypothetical protein L1887_30233 [Cichorium endivia]|nr:hypothetical protein L1887_30233 [Cichorium endivia]